MPIINKVSSELVFDLLNQANPNSPVKFSANNLNLGKLTAITPTAGQIQNTKITLSNKPTSEYIGRVDATYRRLDLSKLFRGLTITISKFSPAVKSGNTTAWASFIKDLLPTFNTQMGTAFTADDFNDVGVGRGALNAQNRYQSTVTVTAKATSPGYVGSFSFVWVDAPQDIDSVVTVTDLDGRLYPGGNDFTDKHVVLNGAGYSVDWTDVIVPALAAIGVAVGYIANYNTVLNRPSYDRLGNVWATLLTELTKMIDLGLVIDPTVIGTDKFANVFSGQWRAIGVTLPSAAYPELNSEFFNQAVLFTPPVKGANSGSMDASTLYTGMLVFHFNNN